MNKKLTRSLSAATAFLVAPASAAILASYPMVGNTNSTTDPDITLTGFVSTHDGVSTAFVPPGPADRAFYWFEEGLSQTNTPTIGDIVFEFALTPSAGNQFTLDATDSVTFITGSFAGSSTETYNTYAQAFISDVSDFSNILASSSVFTVTDASSGVGTIVWDETTALSSALTRSTTTYFGIALTYDGPTSGTNYNSRLTDISVNGTISAIPEPSAALLGGIGMLFMLRRRR